MPSSHTSAQNTTTNESEAKLEYLTDPEINPNVGYVIENQLGQPDYHYGIYMSSPPPADACVNCDKLNEEGEFFFLKERFAKLSFLLAKVPHRVEVSAEEGNGSGIAKIALSLSDKVRTTLSLWYCLQKNYCRNQQRSKSV